MIDNFSHLDYLGYSFRSLSSFHAVERPDEDPNQTISLGFVGFRCDVSHVN